MLYIPGIPEKRPVNVSVLGAGGEVGRALCLHLLRGGFMRPADTLQLVGHGPEGTERRVLAERVDLLDAFDETAPNIEVATGPEEVSGDIVIMAAGVTVSPQTRTRRDLAIENRTTFEAYATLLARHGTGCERVVIVANPVELGVEIFCRHLDRHRVLGMGTQQDSLRFARAVADVAGVHRDRVHAWVLGEHGEAQVPLWSDLRLLGASSGDAGRIVEGLRSGPKHPSSEVQGHRDRVFGLLAQERVREAFAAVEALPPEFRIMLEPFVTAHCLHSTPNATANATLDLLLALGGNRASVVGAQVRLQGEFLGLDTVVGVPVLVDSLGWSRVECPPLTGEEQERLTEAAGAIRANLAEWMG